MKNAEYNTWIFEYLRIKEILGKVNLENLKKIRVAYLDTGCDKFKFDKKNISIKRITLTKERGDSDRTGHGTLFAKIFNRYTSINNCSPQIISIKVGNSALIPIKLIIEGLSIAISEKADIISINSCNIFYNSKIARLLSDAVKKGIIPVSPAGNFISEEYTYPASLDSVIASTSILENGQFSPNANFNECIDICSPEERVSQYIGELKFKNIKETLKKILLKKNIVSKFPLLRYLGVNSFSGTSFSLPIVVAAITLMKTINIKLNVFQVKEIFRDKMTHKVRFSHGNNSFYISNLNFKEAILNVKKLEIKKYSFEDRFFWEFFWDYNLNKIKGHVYNLFGQFEDSLNTRISIRVFPYDPFQTKDRGNVIEEKIILVHFGVMEFDFNHLGKGSYFLRITDKENLVTEALATIKKRN